MRRRQRQMCIRDRMQCVDGISEYYVQNQNAQEEIAFRRQAHCSPKLRLKTSKTGTRGQPDPEGECRSYVVIRNKTGMLTFPIREVSSAKEALADRGFDPESQLRVSEGVSPSSSLSFLIWRSILNGSNQG